MPVPTRRVLPGLPGLSGLPVLLTVLALATSACSSSEAPLIDDGSYSSLEAGAPAALDAVGVTVVSLDQPTSADPNDVDLVLASRRLEADTYAVRAVDGLALDPEKVAGLLGMAGDVEGPRSPDGRYVVLCFDRLDAAIVFAESDPEIFADPELDAARSSYLAGNLVAYYAPGRDGPDGSHEAADRLRAALEALAAGS